MNESAWERTRRKQRNKLLVLLLVICPLCAVAVVLFLNNRDLIGFSAGRSGLVAAVKELPAILPDSTGGVAYAATGAFSGTKVDTPQTPTIVPVAKNQAVASTDSISEKSLPEPLPVVSVTPATSSGNAPLYSEVLPPIPCKLENRKDVVINLSLELFFTDIEQRPAILLRREDIKVMVLRTMRDQELPTLKINELETLLLRSIGSILEHSGINRVKIRNIQIEKAARK